MSTAATKGDDLRQKIVLRKTKTR